MFWSATAGARRHDTQLVLVSSASQHFLASSPPCRSAAGRDAWCQRPTAELNSRGTWLASRGVAAFDLKTSVRGGRPPRFAVPCAAFCAVFMLPFLFGCGFPGGFFGSRCLRVCVSRLYFIFAVILTCYLLRVYCTFFFKFFRDLSTCSLLARTSCQFF